MPKSLSELKSSPDVGLAEYPVKIHVSAKLVGELEAADRALFEAEQALETARAELEAARSADPDAPQRPRRSGETPNADLKRKVEEAEAAAEAAAKASDAIRERMEAVEVVLRGKPSGEWRQWVSKHPARDEDEAPALHQRDRRFAAGFCDIDALVDDLHLWVVKYNGEAPSDDWWEFVSTNGVPADLTAAASRIVQMHEQGVDLGKSRLGWLADRRSAKHSE